MLRLNTTSGILRRLRGAALVEYGILASLVALLAIGSVVFTGERVEETFCAARDAIHSSMNDGGTDSECLTLAGGPGAPGELGSPGAPGGEIPEALPPSGPVIAEEYDPPSGDLVLVYEGTTVSLRIGGPGTVGTVFWGDGTTNEASSNLSVTTFSKTFGHSGPHVVTFAGTATSLQGVSSNLVEVQSFGSVALQTLTGAFEGAHGLRSVAPLPPTVTTIQDIFKNSNANPEGVEFWNTQAVTNFSSAFEGAVNFNRDISNWRTGAGGNFRRMFLNATSFNQDISSWDVRQGSSFDMMFQNADAFNAPIGQWKMDRAANVSQMFYGTDAFSADLSGWDMPLLSSASNAANMFAFATAFTSDLSGWCVPNVLTRPNNFSDGSGVTREPAWGFCGLPQPSANDFVAVYENLVSAPRATMNAAVASQGIIHWGDGTYGSAGYGASHTYAAPGTYEVSIIGDLTLWSNATTSPDLVEVKSFGSSPVLSNLSQAFYNADKLRAVPTSLPSSVRGLTSAFQNMDANPTGVESWDTSNVTSMRMMFKDAKTFNRDISGWNTSSVGSLSPSSLNMSEMFRGATNFARNLSGWCVRNLTSSSHYSNFSTGSQISGLPSWGAVCN